MSPYKNKEDKLTNDRKRYQRKKTTIKKKIREYYHKNRKRIRKRRHELFIKNRGEVNEAARRYYWKLRTEMIRAYGGECVCCGESESLFLELDHIKNDGWKRKDKSAGTLYRQVRREGFPKDKFQLLCANCNQGKRRNQGLCPHQKKSL